MFNVTHVSGAMSPGDKVSLSALLDELSSTDAEHPDISVLNESGLSLSVLSGWRLILENVEENSTPRWIETKDRDLVLQAMNLVAQGGNGLGSVFDWSEGYGPTTD